MAFTDLVINFRSNLDFRWARNAAAKSVNRIGTDRDYKVLEQAVSFELGNIANQCNRLFADERPLAASTTEHLNISGGAHSGAVALTDPAGVAVTFTKLRVIYVVNTGTTTLTIGGDATDNLTALFGDNTDKINLLPGMILPIVVPTLAAIAVAADEVITVINTSGSVAGSYQIVLAGSV